MPVPDQYTLAPELLKGLFDTKPIKVKVTANDRLSIGNLSVTTFGGDHVSMTVQLFSSANLNQFDPTNPTSGQFGMTQEMLDRVVAENGGQSYFADWSDLKEAPPRLPR